MEHLFIKQCSSLIETMLFCKKEQETRKLHMCFFVEQTEYYYAANVLGHHATMSDITPFKSEDVRNPYLESIILNFAYQLESACRVLFSTSHFAVSIFEESLTARKKYATATMLMSDEELTLAYLNKEEPSYDDVIEYLELVIHKTEQRIEESL